MSSVLRSVRKRKKGHTLGAVDVIDREEYAELEVEAKVELIRSLVPLGLMHIEEVLDEEVTALAGERYARKDPSVGGRRHGSNPGTVGLAGQRVPIRVPRIRHVTEREIPLRSYEALHGDRAVNDLLLRRVLYGISYGIDAPICQDTRSGGLDDLLASAEIGHDALVDLASEETFQAPDDLSLGSAVRRAACDVINGRLMVPHADDDGSIEGGVGVSVAASIEAVPVRCV